MAKSSLIFVCLLLSSCTNINKLGVEVPAKIIGRLINGETNSVMVAQEVSEYDNPLNKVSTDSKGEFEITLQNNIPVLVIHGFYNSILVKVEVDKRNDIVFNSKLIKESSRIKRSLK